MSSEYSFLFSLGMLPAHSVTAAPERKWNFVIVEDRYQQRVIVQDLLECWDNAKKAHSEVLAWLFTFLVPPGRVQDHREMLLWHVGAVQSSPSVPHPAWADACWPRHSGFMPKSTMTSIKNWIWDYFPSHCLLFLSCRPPLLHPVPSCPVTPCFPVSFTNLFASPTVFIALLFLPVADTLLFLLADVPAPRLPVLGCRFLGQSLALAPCLVYFPGQLSVIHYAGWAHGSSLNTFPCWSLPICLFKLLLLHPLPTYRTYW